MNDFTSDTITTTVPVTDEDIDELFADIGPEEFQMRAMITLALSDEGLRPEAFGEGGPADEAWIRFEIKAVRAGLAVEHSDEGARGERLVIRERWLPEFRTGLTALLDWDGRSHGRPNVGLVRWISTPEHRVSATPLLHALDAMTPMVTSSTSAPPGTRERRTRS